MLTVGLRDVLRRPAANMPGKIALYVDPHLIADLRGKLARGSVVVVGTNGKTSTANLLADALASAGQQVICNRTGANLDSGVATALLQQPAADWGVFECDELWLAKVTPGLQPTYVLLLNLFRDQLDRCGEIDRIQESIIGSLVASPSTVLVYNADDPLCAAIAAKAPNRSVAFGIDEDLGLAQNTVADAQMCQMCDAMMGYDWRQYGQLGKYHCDSCGFERPALAMAAHGVELGADRASFEAVAREGAEGAEGSADAVRIATGQASPYVVYNLLAAWAAAHLMGVPVAAFQQAVDEFDPQNGRLQRYVVNGHPVLLNLAKNPTGFNQNLKIIAADQSPKAIAFFLNAHEGDGRDTSWIWDIDMEELAGQDVRAAFAGGESCYDMQIRLKYAGLEAERTSSIDAVFEALAAPGCPLPPDATVYAIANYTALPPVKKGLDALAAKEDSGAAKAGSYAAEDAAAATPEAASGAPEPPNHRASHPSAGVAGEGETLDGPAIRIVHLYPDLLNLYGDNGNVRILAQRLRWRGIPVEVREVHNGETADLSQADLVFLGGGPDREQRLASTGLMALRDELARFIDEDGPLLAICGGYQILGSQWLWGDELVPGLGIVDLETRRPGTSADRLTGDLVMSSPLASHPVVGYENHAGRTYLGEGVEPLGAVVSKAGHGNNDADRADGVRYRNVVGTYSHGPLLSKNPEVADWLLARALERQARRVGTEPLALSPLDDAVELAANRWMTARLGVEGA